MSLESIDEKAIAEIEKFVNEDKDFLKNTVYHKNTEFKLLPGHRSIILDIPKKIAKYRSEKENQSIGQCLTQNISPEREIELKDKLLKKLINYAKTFKYSIEIKQSDIFDFNSDSVACRCRVKCPFCEKKILCVYRTFWAVSNIEQHIKADIKKFNVIISNNEKKDTIQSTSLIDVHRVKPGNDIEIQKIIHETV